METSQHTHINNSMENYASCILFLVVGICQWLGSLPFESIYMWSFRGISFVSVVLVIIINWPKAKAILFKKKKQKNDFN